MVKHGAHEYLGPEEKRLKEDKERTKYWKKWGPYLSEYVVMLSCPCDEALTSVLDVSGEPCGKITRKFYEALTYA